MVPTLQDGEFVLVNKLSYKFGEVSRGDIIVFHFPLNPNEDLIKRVIALAGAMGIEKIVATGRHEVAPAMRGPIVDALAE